MRSSKPRRRDGIVFRSRAPPSLIPFFVTLTLVHSLLLYSEPEGDPVRVVALTIIIIVVFVVFR